MAHLHNLGKHTQPSFLSNIGEKVKHVAEAIGTAKGLYEVGRGKYQIGSMAAPIIAGLLYKKFKLIYIYI